MRNGLTLDEITSIGNFIDPTNNLVEIPFPLKREVWYYENSPIISITINYEKVNKELDCYKENELRTF